MLIEGGVLRVWDRRHRLLARVQRTENRMYRLELQVPGHSVSRCIRTTMLGAGTNDSATQISGHLKRWVGWR
jgi:hypothetical protein